MGHFFNCPWRNGLGYFPRRSFTFSKLYHDIQVVLGFHLLYNRNNSDWRDTALVPCLPDCNR